MKKCPYCAEEIQDEAIYCKYCHHDLSVSPPKKIDTGEVTSVTQGEEKNHPWLVIFLILIIVTLSAAFLILLAGKNKISANYNVNNPTITPIKELDATSYIQYSTDFSVNDGNWLEKKDGLSDFDVINGKYLVNSIEKNMYTWAHLPKEFDDAVLVVDLIHKSSLLTDSSGYLITWRQTDEENYYGVTIMGDGSVYVYKVVNKKETKIYSSEGRVIILNNEKNPVHIYFNESRVSIFINGQLITTFSDMSFIKGNIGLGVVTDNGNGATVAFDNLQIYSSRASEIILPKNRATPIPYRSSSNDCTLWSEISLSDVGETKCVYGTVINAYYNENLHAFIFTFTGDSQAIYFIKHDDLYWDDVIGRCVSVTGKIEKYYQTPFIEIKEDCVYYCD